MMYSAPWCMRGPLTPLASGAEVLVPGTEADGVADAMIEAPYPLFLPPPTEKALRYGNTYNSLH